MSSLSDARSASIYDAASQLPLRPSLSIIAIPSTTGAKTPLIVPIVWRFDPSRTAPSLRRVDARQRRGNRASPGDPSRSPPGGPSGTGRSSCLPRGVERAVASDGLRRPRRTCAATQSHPLRPPIKDVGLDSLVGGDGESCDVVLPCSEGLDRALPADLRIILSKETIGGEIVDRDGNHKPFDSRGVAALAQGRPVQDVVRQERFLDISACAEQLARRGESSGTSAIIRGGPRIASFEPSEVSR